MLKCGMPGCFAQSESAAAHVTHMKYFHSVTIAVEDMMLLERRENERVEARLRAEDKRLEQPR